MPTGVRRGVVIVGAVVVLLAALPGPAWAHEIGSVAGLSVWGFVPLGIEHMLLGWDHLLFIAGVVLLAGELKRAAKLISVFVAGHSTTLIIATLVGWRLDALLVDVVIAFSVAFVGVVGFVGRPAATLGAGSRWPCSGSDWCTAWACPPGCKSWAYPRAACWSG